MIRDVSALGSDVSINLCKDLEDHGGACLSLSYTSNMRFSESRLLAIIGLPWPMTPPASMLSGTTTQEAAIAAKAAMAVVLTMTRTTKPTVPEGAIGYPAQPRLVCLSICQ